MTLTRLLVSVLCAVPSWSAIVYTNLGPADIYTSAYTVYGGSWVAAQFAPSESGPLGTVLLPLVRNGFTDATGPLLVSLRAPGADPNGAALESWTLTPENVSPSPGMIHVLDSLLRPVLTAGSSYWLRVESAGPLPFQSYGWGQNAIATGDPGPAAVSLNGGLSWAAAGPNPAFEVSTASNAIPEPASVGLLALGLVAVILRLPRRR